MTKQEFNLVAKQAQAAIELVRAAKGSRGPEIDLARFTLEASANISAAETAFQLTRIADVLERYDNRIQQGEFMSAVARSAPVEQR